MCYWPNNQGQYVLHTLFELNNCTVLNIKQLNQPCAFHLQQLIPFSLYSSPTNSLIVTVVPSFGTLVNSILPPCASPISFEIDSHNPAPPLSLERDFSTRYSRSSICGKSASGTPSPSSLMLIMTWSAVFVTTTVIVEFACACFCALSKILMSTC